MRANLSWQEVTPQDHIPFLCLQTNAPTVGSSCILEFGGVGESSIIYDLHQILFKLIIVCVKQLFRDWEKTDNSFEIKTSIFFFLNQNVTEIQV